MGRDIIKWTDPVWSKVSPKSLSTYFAPFPVSAQFSDSVRALAPGASLIVGYGSQFSRETGNSSKMRDVMIFVEGDTRAFHEQNTQARPADYGMGPNVGFHTRLNEIGMNFYKTQVDGPVKYGVIGTDLLARHAGLNRADGEYTPIQNLYVPGRSQKRLVVIEQTEGAGRDIALQSITKARIDGVTLALSRTKPELPVSLRDLAYGVSRLSYDGDVRFENPRKAINQVDANWDDWQKMLLPIVGQMAEAGFVEQTEEQEYIARVVVPPETVRKLILDSRSFAFGSNYFKNWATFGPVRGLTYVGSKVIRNIAQNNPVSSVSN